MTSPTSIARRPPQPCGTSPAQPSKGKSEMSSVRYTVWSCDRCQATSSTPMAGPEVEEEYHDERDRVKTYLQRFRLQRESDGFEDIDICDACSKSFAHWWGKLDAPQP